MMLLVETLSHFILQGDVNVRATFHGSQSNSSSSSGALSYGDFPDFFLHENTAGKHLERAVGALMMFLTHDRWKNPKENKYLRMKKRCHRVEDKDEDRKTTKFESRRWYK